MKTYFVDSIKMLFTSAIQLNTHHQGYDKKHFLFPSGEADKIYIQPQQFVLIIIVG